MNIGTNAAESAPSANRSRVRFGNREADTKRVEDGARAEHRREHDFANQPGDAADSNCDGDNPRRTYDVVGLGSFYLQTAFANRFLSSGRTTRENGLSVMMPV